MEFSVSTAGTFVAPHLWFIHASVDYSPRLDDDARERVRRQASIELMRRVMTESRLGWHLGAHSIRVFVEGDHENVHAA